MPRSQRTVARAGGVEGVGLHTGAAASLTVKPAPPGSGLVFVRTDLAGAPRIRADARHLRAGARRTVLWGERGAEVHTVEHFLACCFGLGVDNLECEISGPECPGMDGSGRDFADLLDGLGTVEQDAPREEIVVEHAVGASADGPGGLVALPRGEGFEVSYTLDYAHPHIGRQHLSVLLTPERFRSEIAGARTFCLASEAEALRAQNLGRGATYENTLVVGDEGVIQNTPRWPDEFVRHKILDLIGDLALVGADIRGHVHAYRTGHAANLELVRALRAGHATGQALPTPAMLQQQIRRVLPHRYPFLLVDRVLQVQGFQRAVGIKNVTVNEPYFMGHYPEQAIMPGVLIVEAMAQLAGILLLRKLELSGKLPVLISIDRVKFRRAVQPGDQLVLEAETLRLSGGRGRVQCRARVEDRLVAESRLNFALTEGAAT
jgi:UDP-3-O-[3-hydroxymyristoyl] N-acetylglucosamine deacetylase/3-hydroxyacyl-[acyl-carrier-protein] dehydratase